MVLVFYEGFLFRCWCSESFRARERVIYGGSGAAKSCVVAEIDVISKVTTDSPVRSVLRKLLEILIQRCIEFIGKRLLKRTDMSGILGRPGMGIHRIR